MNNVREPNDVRLLYGTRGNDVGINLVTFKPEGEEQGYFLLLAAGFLFWARRRVGGDNRLTIADGFAVSPASSSDTRRPSPPLV